MTLAQLVERLHCADCRHLTVLDKVMLLNRYSQYGRGLTLAQRGRVSTYGEPR